MVETYTPKKAILDAADMEYLPSSGIPDLNLDTLHDYRNFFRLYQPGHPYNALNDETFLERIGGSIEIDKETKLTKAGLLLFGNDHIIRRFYPYFSLLFIDERDPFIIQQQPIRIETFSGTWAGNLFGFIVEVSSKVATAQQAFKHIERNDGYLVQLIRELLSIALCNVDFSAGEGISFIIGEKGLSLSFAAPNKIELSSLNQGYVANPTIANALGCINLAKRRGMGLPFIRKLAKQLQFGKISVDQSIEKHEIRIEIEFVKSQISRQTPTISPAFDAYLEQLEIDESFTRSDVIKATGKSPATVSIYIKKALDEGLIVLSSGYVQGKYRKNH